MAPSFFDAKTKQPVVHPLEPLVQENIKKFRNTLRPLGKMYVPRARMHVLGYTDRSVVVKTGDDDVVMKISPFDEDFLHEIEMLRHMNKHTKTSTSPMCPRYHCSFSVNKKFAVILMKNITQVFKKYTDIGTYTNRHYKLLQRTLKRLHEHGVCHNDLKPEHIYVFTYPNDRYKMCFLDYGSSFLIDDEHPSTDKSRLHSLQMHS